MSYEQQSGPADELAGRTFAALAAPINSAEAEAAEQAQQAAEQAGRQFLDAAEKGLVAALMVARSIGARRLPPLRDEVTDPMLKEWATAAVPVAGVWLQRVMASANMSPEAAALVAATVPIGLAVLSALDKHRRTVDVQAREVPAAEVQ